MARSPRHFYFRPATDAVAATHTRCCRIPEVMNGCGR
jgi:hypothetical protein